MKKFITAVFCTALAVSSGLTASAAENLDRYYIETEIWEDMWNGKGDNGLDFPEASYKHHLLDEWLDENYGSDDYDWSEIGELKYEYKDYYRNLIEDWDFEDDENGGWTIVSFIVRQLRLKRVRTNRRTKEILRSRQLKTVSRMIRLTVGESIRLV